jgi:RNA polymerase sigma-70 factor (ECF subfamily)
MAMKRTALLLASCLLVGVGQVWALASEGERVEMLPERSTRLYIRTIPPGAEIRLNGKQRGFSDHLFRVPPGVRKMTLEVELDGHFPKQQEVEIRGGWITRVVLELEARPRDTAAEPLTNPFKGGNAIDAIGLVHEQGKTHWGAKAEASSTYAAILGKDERSLGGVDTLPPVVVETAPQSGDTNVDPSVAEIRVTFSKEMTDGSWSWSQISDETFPQMTEAPRYLADKRTCVLPVKLQAAKTYVFWLNSAKFGNFKDAQGRSAVPYLLIFETRK